MMISFLESIGIRRIPDVKIDMVCAALPLPLCIASVIFDAYSPDIEHVIIGSMLVGPLILLVRHLMIDWKDGKLAGLSIITGFLVWYAIPAIVNLYTNGTAYRDILPVPIDEKTTIRAVFYLSTFMVTWVMASFFFHRFRLFQPIVRMNSCNVNPNLLTGLGIIFCAIGFIPFIFSGLGINEVISLILQGRLAEKPWIHWDNLGNLRSSFLYLSHSSMAAGACVLWFVSQEKTFSATKKFITLLTAFTITLIIYFDQGTRSIIALIVLPAIVYKLNKLIKLFNIKILIASFMSIVLFVLFLRFQLLYREVGSFALMSRPNIINLLTLEDTTDLFSETVFSLSIVPSLHDYFKESSFYQFIISPIPRFLWPSKPVSQVVWFYTLRRWGIDIHEGGGNVFPGIVGQSYMSWGMLGPIFLGIVLGWFSSRIDILLNRTNNFRENYFSIPVLMMCIWLFLSYRVISPGFVYPIIIVYMLIIISNIFPNAFFYKSLFKGGS